MPKPKGGRGKRVPYRTQSMRVPVALMQQFQAEIEQYRLLVMEGDKDYSEESVTPLDEAIARVQNDPTVTRGGKMQGR